MKPTIETAKTIIKHHFGKVPKGVRELSGGLVNFIYDVEVDGDRFVVRIAEDQPKIQYFLKERWAAEKARALKVPAPEILEVSNEASEFPYMITRWIPGTNADRFPHPIRGDVIRELGRYAALINSIPTSGFGHVFDWSGNQLSRNETWKDYLEKEFLYEKRLSSLERHSMLTEDGMAKLRAAVKEVVAWDMKPRLCHGDLRLKNVLVDEKGKVSGILDWEFCTSNIAPYWDLCLSLDEFNLDERALFLEGYGMSHTEYRKIANSVKALNVLHFSEFVDVAFEEKNELKRKEIADAMRTRLRGAFDMYSLE